MLEAATAGLNKAVSLAPTHGYWETLAGASLFQGVNASSELAWKLDPTAALSARVFGSTAPTPDYGFTFGFRKDF